MSIAHARSLVRAVIAAFAIALLPAGAKAQTIDDICYESWLDLGYDEEDAVAISYAPPGSFGAWCVKWFEQTIEFAVRLQYGLALSDVHPSEISAALDGGTPKGGTRTLTAFLYNDLLYLLFSTTYRWQHDCAGPICRATNPVTGAVQRSDIRKSKFSGRGIQWNVLGEKDGVTLVKRESRTTGNSGTKYDWKGYGGWASDSMFFSRWQAGVDGRYEGSGQVWSYSAGRASIGNPRFLRARYSGFMTGIDVGSSLTRGNPILGKADIAFDGLGAVPTVDVSFTEVLDVATLEERRDMHWYDIAVRNGAFRRGVDSYSIQGRFYGTRHQEVGGIFERDRISGAFGAKKR